MGRDTSTLAVDLGTTTVKAAAFADRDGRQIAAARTRVGVTSDESGAAIQEPGPIYDEVTGLMARVAAQSASAGFDVVRVGCSAAMHSVMAVDKSGRPLTPVLTWMDTRATARAKALWMAPEGRAVYARTGTPVHAMSPLAKILWLHEHRRELWESDVRFVSLKEWIWHRWFGEWCVDRSTASASGLYSLEHGDWDEGALAIAGIGTERLSAVVRTTHQRTGPSDDRLDGTLARATFVIGATDGVLANLGVDAIDGRRVVLTVGTSLAVRAGAARPVTHEPTRSFCYALDDDRYVVGAASNSGGVVLDWMRTHLLASGPEAVGDALAVLLARAGETEADGLFCMPYVAGERAPLWDAKATAALVGLRLSHTGIHVIRAAVEGMLFNGRWIADWLFEQAAPPVEIVTAGRLFSHMWIRQLVADVFGLPVRDAGPVDASLHGAAALARIATGDLGWTDVAAWLPAPGALEHPGDTVAWLEKYGRFREVAARLVSGVVA